MLLSDTLNKRDKIQEKFSLVSVAFQQALVTSSRQMGPGWRRMGGKHMTRKLGGMTRQQMFWLILAAIAWFIESYDIGLISVVLLPFKELWHLTASDTGLLVASATVGIVCGVIPSGYFADRFGRKRMLVASMAMYSILTVVTGLMPGWQSVAVMRFLAGLGLGAMFPLPYTLLTELSPRKGRGAVAGVLDAFLSIGYFTAPLAGGFIMGSMGLLTGWRILFYVSAMGLVYALILARYLPESPRWLASQGREAEARAIWARVERQGGVVEPMAEIDAPPKRPVAVLVSRPYLKRTIMLWIGFPSILFVFYAIMTFMPSVLAKEHLTGPVVLQFSALIMAASIPGKLCEAWLVERIGRKAVIVSFTVIAAGAALLFPGAHTTPAIVGIAMLMAFFGVAVDPAIKVFSAEQYPTAIRGTGVGMTEGIGRLLGGAFAPYIMALLLSSSGIRGSFLFIAGVALVGAMAVGILGQETRGKSLNERIMSAGVRA